MKIFVTGATGYLGYHFVNVAVSQGHDVLCLKRSTSKSLFEPIVEEKIQWVLNDERLEEKVKAFKPDVLFHAAWGGVRTGRGNVAVQNENIQMTMNVMKMYPYKQIIMLGSQDEYGYYHGPVSEGNEAHPESEYGKAKVYCSKQLRKYCESNNIAWQWIRIFTVFGEKQTGGLIKTIYNRIKAGDAIFDTTLGQQTYSYLYSFDYARAVCNVVGELDKSGIYNLSQPQELHKNIDILELVKRKMNSDIQINYGAIPYFDGQIMYMHGDVTKFENAFGSIPHTQFEFALTNTLDSFV